SKPDKVLFPDPGITKAELARYYERVAPAMLPHVRDRPLNLWLYPNGIDGKGFLRQQIHDHYPDWIRRVKVRQKGGSVTHEVAENAETLGYIAGQHFITPPKW